MLMIFAVLIKVLFIDVSMLSAGKGIILLITLGIMLVLFSVFFSRMRKQTREAGNQANLLQNQHPEQGTEK